MPSVLLSKGGFNLTKWVSNDREVLATISEERRSKQIKEIDFNHEALPVERVLSVRLDIEEDCFTFKINIKEKPITRSHVTKKVIDQLSGNEYDLSFLGMDDGEPQIPHPQNAKQKESVLLKMAPSDSDTDSYESDTECGLFHI